MIIGANSASSGPDGTSHSLASSADRRILRTIRQHADVVIVGAASVRAEGWFLPPHGTLLVLSASGELPWESCPDRSRVIICTTVQEVAAHMTMHPGRYLCEGGLTTVRALEVVHPFDEIALTTRIAADQALALVTAEPARYLPAHVIHEVPSADGVAESFILWRRAATT